MRRGAGSATFCGKLALGICMRLVRRRLEFLEKARDADDRARSAKENTLRESWQRIAAGYRELAARHL